MVGFPSFISPFNNRKTKDFKKFSSGLDFSDGSNENNLTFSIPLTPQASKVLGKSSWGSQLRKNKGEQGRLQGLMRVDSIINVSGEAPEPPVTTGKWTQMRAWMVNEGKFILSTGAVLEIIMGDFVRRES